MFQKLIKNSSLSLTKLILSSIFLFFAIGAQAEVTTAASFEESYPTIAAETEYNDMAPEAPIVPTRTSSYPNLPTEFSNFRDCYRKIRKLIKPVDPSGYADFSKSHCIQTGFSPGIN